MRDIITCMSKLEIKNLSFSYGDDRLVIDDISFAVEKGSFVAVLGHNGSGLLKFHQFHLPLHGQVFEL